MQHDAIKDATRALLQAIGEDPDREGLVENAARTGDCDDWSTGTPGPIVDDTVTLRR